ncbi:MAG: hypothetical protein PHQ54_00010 [Candidatus Omnitrophica bacterium]|nr:hypothetical protein [Candidatus Omnitrophota bacterium]
MVLMEVRNSSGLVGRCDAKCYDAKCPECNCICGGVNHGRGKQEAADNTREFVADQVKKLYSRKDGRVRVFENILQKELFL